MIQIGEAIQRVQSIYSKGVQSKDSRLTPRHIYSCLCTARSIILQRRSDSNKYISHENYQTISCVNLIDSPLHDVASAPKGCKYLRTEIQLPQIVHDTKGPLIYQVASLDNSLSFDRKEFNNFKYTPGRKYTANKNFYFLKDKYIFLGVIKKLQGIPITAIFHDPYQAFIHPTCDNCTDCKCKDPFSLDFHLDGELLDAVIKLASQEAIILLSQMREDTLNDASDTGETKGAMIHQP